MKPLGEKLKHLKIGEKIMKNKFNIDDKVYHRTPGSPKGIVLEVRYWLSSDSYDYLVAWGYNDKSFCNEEELSDKRNN